MARIARAVIPGLPHHVTQRGSRRQPTFFSDDDYALYLDVMATACRRWDVEVWAYCLMPNHAHLVMIPSTEDGLRRAVGEAHRRYSTQINDRQGWRGYLWQYRFASYVMDERHLLAAVRYVERNPVRAGMVERASEWPWSSARAHLARRDDRLVKVAPMLDRVQDWSAYLREEAAETEALRRHARSGRPLGDDAFVDDVERIAGRPLRTLPRGRPRKTDQATAAPGAPPEN